MFEIFCTYSVGVLFCTAAWMFDSWMMKDEAGE